MAVRYPLCVFFCLCITYVTAFAVAGRRIWNSLPPSIRDLTPSAGTFATLLKTYLFV